MDIRRKSKFQYEDYLLVAPFFKYYDINDSIEEKYENIDFRNLKKDLTSLKKMMGNQEETVKIECKERFLNYQLNLDIRKVLIKCA